MVKIARGRGRGRRRPGPEPMPLFPANDLPVFGPPPVNLRRPLLPRAPPPVPHRPPPMMFGRPPRLPPRLPLLGPPGPPRRMPLLGPGPPRGLRPLPPPHGRPPLLPNMALRHPPRGFLGVRGRGRGGRIGMGPKRLGRAEGKNRRAKKRKEGIKSEEVQTKADVKISGNEEEVLEGPWISDSLKEEVAKLAELKTAMEGKGEGSVEAYTKHRTKVLSLATAARAVHEEALTTQTEPVAPVVEKNGTVS